MRSVLEALGGMRVRGKDAGEKDRLIGDLLERENYTGLKKNQRSESLKNRQ